VENAILQLSMFLLQFSYGCQCSSHSYKCLFHALVLPPLADFTNSGPVVNLKIEKYLYSYMKL
jgi:hypothetical protein